MCLSIEVSGTIIKKESLTTINSDINNNILILETAHAFPGYHGIIPEEKLPGSLFLITKKKYSKEFILRSAKALKKSLKMKLDLASSRITLRNNDVFAIRIKCLNNYSILPQLIQALSDEGYRFEKYRNSKEFSSIIQVKKEFLLEEIEAGFYRDKSNTETHYFEIKNELKWYAFEKAVTDIKYNTKDNNFDAALATFYRVKGVIDLVRIYKKDLSLNELKQIKEKLCNYIHE
ncbi:MAG: hypothetical protein J7K39_04640 [Bacteroidales bacterium]|nr:hypothetical protein [Bacteroidales bacterium]RLD39422.1 MAG: hypothetical protein DRI74_00895 [Bacteroidota bacterium]